MTRYTSVAIVGVGLIGGSIGLALRERKIAKTVVGIGRRSESLRRATEIGAIDVATTDLAQGVASADIIVVCTPVGKIAEHVRAAAAACPDGALLTDAGSTKSRIVTDLTGEGCADPVPAFVGSHPLAGDHRAGADHARANLFEGRMVVVTPPECPATGSVDRTRAFWEHLGARVEILSPEAHDAILAATSHVPHLVAAALASMLPIEQLPFTATGWRDTTRIAAGEPSLWRDIIESNRSNVCDKLLELEKSLSAWRQAIDAGEMNRIEGLLATAKKIRDAADRS